MDKKNILVVGGTSFIALKFIEAYNSSYNIHSISRRDNVHKNNSVFKDFFKIPTSTFDNIDVVINFTAIVHKPEIKDEFLYESINCKLPISLAEKAKKNGCLHFIQISTIAVYGEVEFINKETTYKPINDYGASKLKADLALEKMANDNFLISCIRPSMVYGGGNSPGNMTSLIKLAKTKLPLPFKGIKNKRQFLHVNNLTQALNGIIEKKITGIVLIADEEVISTASLIDTIQNSLGLNNRNYKFALLWKLAKKIKPNTVRKLTSNLIIENTYTFSKLGVDSPKSVKTGIKEMIAAIK